MRYNVNSRRRGNEYFYKRATELLGPYQRDYIFCLLRELSADHDVGKLVRGLRTVLSDVHKRELIFPLRDLIQTDLLIRFDRVMSRAFCDEYITKRKSRMDRMLADMEVQATLPSGDGILGMSVRGGTEHKLGIYICDVETGSIAASRGLEPGDQILEADGVNLENIDGRRALEVLTSGRRMKLRLKRTGYIPNWKHSHAKISWYNTNSLDEEIGAEDDFTDADIEMAAAMGIVEGLERMVNFTELTPDSCLGFNIRGGSEFGTGIYVSSVDARGLADHNGLRVGDKVLDVNGTSMTGTVHADAVEVFKKYPNLVITVRDAGRYPLYKEVMVEYSWSKVKYPEGNTSSREKVFDTKLHGETDELKVIADIATEADKEIREIEVERTARVLVHQPYIPDEIDGKDADLRYHISEIVRGNFVFPNSESGSVYSAREDPRSDEKEFGSSSDALSYSSSLLEKTFNYLGDHDDLLMSPETKARRSHYRHGNDQVPNDGALDDETPVVQGHVSPLVIKKSGLSDIFATRRLISGKGLAEPASQDRIDRIYMNTNAEPEPSSTSSSFTENRRVIYDSRRDCVVMPKYQETQESGVLLSPGDLSRDTNMDVPNLAIGDKRSFEMVPNTLSLPSSSEIGSDIKYTGTNTQMRETETHI